MNIKEINSQKEFGFSCIYLWKNLINGKCYVGQASNFYSRMSAYKHLRTNPYLKNAFEKYGFDNFDISIIEKLPKDKKILTQREQYWLDFYESYNPNKGYNICHYAETTLGLKKSKQEKELLKKIKLDYYTNPINRQKFQGVNNGMYGKHHTKEAKEKISNKTKELWKDEKYRITQSQRMKGENNYFYNKHLYGELNGMYGKHHNNESKKKISKAKLGKPNKKIRKPIKCVETGEVFDSVTTALKKLGLSKSAMTPALKNSNRICGGYHWKYLNEN